MNFNMDDLMSSFEIMGKGMFSIFAVIIIITLIVALLTRINSAPKKKPEDQNQTIQ